MKDRLDGGVEPAEDPAVLQRRKQLVETLGLRAHLVLGGDPLDEGTDEAQRLDGCPVGGPGVPGRIHRMASGSTPCSISQQHVSIDVLPPPITVKPDAGSVEAEELVGRDDDRGGVDRVGPRVLRGHRRLDVGGIDELAPYPYRHGLTGDP